jgi:microcystin degradation protein MlrC
MRIAVGGVFQETNTFSPLLTKTDDFIDGFMYSGQEIVDNLRDKNIEYAGVIKASQDYGFELIPTFAAFSWPGGKMTSETFNLITNKLLDSIRTIENYDALILLLHGAISAEGCDDVSGHIVKASREIVGEKPIIVAHDLHANVTKNTVAYSDAVVGYLTYPHTDLFETGYRAAELAYRMLKRQLKTEVIAGKIPLILPPQTTSTSEKPTQIIIRKIKQYIEKYKIYSYFLFFTQPWLDVCDLGSGLVLTVGKNISKKAIEICEEILEKLWKYRYVYGEKLNLISIEEGLSMIKNVKGLTVFGDGADAPSAGAPGDNVNILHHLVENNFEGTALMTIYDPEVVRLAFKTGKNNELHTTLGGKIDNAFSNPVEVRGTIIDIRDDFKFSMESKTLRGLTLNAGKTALMKVKNIYVAITEKRFASWDPAIYSNLGLDPNAANLIVAKSPLGYKLYYKDKARLMLDIDNKGFSTSNFGILPYKNVQRPIYPLEYYTKYKLDIYY